MLYIGQPHVGRPTIAAHRDQVAALVLAAIDQWAAHVAHVTEADLLRAVQRIIAPVITRGLLPVVWPIFAIVARLQPVYDGLR